jgi:protein SCO1/2
MRLILAVVLILAAAPARALDPLAAAGIDPHPGSAITIDQTFLDQDGRAVTLRRIGKDKPLLVIPVQYDCPNICGVTLAGFLQSIAGQGLRADEDFVVATLAIDPKETPRDARAMLQRLGTPLPVHALTGNTAEIRATTQALGYRYAWDPRLRQYDHVAAAAVLSADGHLSAWVDGVAPEPRDLKLALTAAGQGRVGSWTDRLLLLCYHYDPETGRYTPLVLAMLRILAGAVLFLTLLLIGREFVRWSARR